MATLAQTMGHGQHLAFIGRRNRVGIMGEELIHLSGKGIQDGEPNPGIVTTGGQNLKEDGHFVGKIGQAESEG